MPHVDRDLDGTEVVRVQLELDGVAPVVARSSGPTAANTCCCTGTGIAAGAGAGAGAGAPAGAGTTAVGATCPGCTVAAGTEGPAAPGSAPAVTESAGAVLSVVGEDADAAGFPGLSGT